jgi:hypothetical protein
VARLAAAKQKVRAIGEARRFDVFIDRPSGIERHGDVADQMLKDLCFSFFSATITAD